MMKLIRFLKAYRLPTAIVLALVFIQTLSELYLPTLMADIVDTGIVTGDVNYIWKMGGLMLLIAGGGMLCAIGASYWSSKVAVGFGKDLRAHVFRHVENFSLQEFDKVGTSSLITRTTNDINQVQQVLVMILRIMVMAPIMCIGGLIMAVSKDGPLTMVLAVGLPLLALVIFFIARKGIPLFKAMQVKLDKLNLVVREGLIGIRVVRAFNRVEHEQKRFEEASRDLTDTGIKVNRIMALLMPVMMLVMNLTTIAIIAFGSLRIESGSMQVGDLMAFIQYAMQIMFSLVMLSLVFVLIPRASASAARINEVLDMKPELTDAEQPKSADVGKKGYLEFDQVTFRYPGAEEAALSDISFQARPGEITAIIGGTGSGKSTLMNLIPRFYDVSEGAIRLSGVDVRELEQGDLRHKIGLVPQKAVLFSGTVAENIRHGKDDATDEEVRHAAAVAQAADFIEAMGDGYETMVSQGGTNLSGGQKQRLSIARALVRRPDVYLFDDSFSALDFKTDAMLRAALKQETKEATLIIIAQRVSTVMDADQIIVLNDGKIASIGTHQELLKSSEVYQEIVASQLTEEEIA
ncbi:ABC transporter ATP-binding protein/permease [Paenibacillus sp. SC116]|uniref:ABC transporter ATP-binding protein n=1 Tax=Paenibacillus sp. SC116 TaxID=2968986 RepID=UPI00215A7D55|nr:ABC transporter ATP-binding protein [Paenibacillus sp. SC116]MCR8844608.1 ABC transporter ATP-binding protein/permease [Paenibacillus sp. SC116]